MLAEVEHGGITDDGLLRAAVFKGLREDLPLPAMQAPSIAPAAGTWRKRTGGVPPENILQLLPRPSFQQRKNSSVTGRKSAGAPSPISAGGR